MIIMAGYKAVSLQTFQLVQDAAVCYLIAQAAAGTGHSSLVKPLLCSLNVDFAASVFTFNMLCPLDTEYGQHTVEIAVNSFILGIQHKLFTTRVRFVFAFLMVDPKLYHLIHCGRILNLLSLRTVKGRLKSCLYRMQSVHI